MKGYLFIAVLTAAVVGCDAITAHTDVVARVGRHELTVDGTVEMLAGSPQVPARPEVIGSVAELWVDYTILARMAASDSTLAELDLGPMVEPYVEQQTFTQLREQVMTTDTVIGGDELRQAFAEQAPGLRVRARHILLTYPEGADDEARDSVQAVAEELRERAAAGEEFEELAAEYSQDQGTAQAGGDLGWFGRGRMVQPFEDAAFALESGEVSEVVETPFGLHLIKVEERETPAWDEERGEQFRQQLVSE
ncbi:MAG: peptidylprolyl isomerase, partial [Gemmatimonadota bacterium]